MPRIAGKLGKAPANYDPRTLSFEHYRDQLPVPPPSIAWDKNIQEWGMMLNDQLGDCVCAAVGHALQATSANAGTEGTVQDGDILAAYEAYCGYNPEIAGSDAGCVELDILKHWRADGVGGHKLGAYASIAALTDEVSVKQTIALLGFIFVGFEVPAFAITQYEHDQPWDVQATNAGIIGGHAVICIDYDAEGLTCITWGTLQRMTWEFWRTYVDEAYACFTPEWIETDGKSPSGFDTATLLQDVQDLGNQPSPPTPIPDSDSPLEDWLLWIAEYLVSTRDQRITDYWGQRINQVLHQWGIV